MKRPRKNDKKDKKKAKTNGRKGDKKAKKNRSSGSLPLKWDTSEQPPVKSTMASQVEPPEQSTLFRFLQFLISANIPKEVLSKSTLERLIGAVQLGIGLLKKVSVYVSLQCSPLRAS